MSSNKNSYPIPDGYKEIEFQTEHHIDHIGKGFHKKDAEGNLVMAFYVKPENGNSGGVAHGGMLMSIADYSLCSAAMALGFRSTSKKFFLYFIMKID